MEQSLKSNHHALESKENALIGRKKSIVDASFLWQWRQHNPSNTKHQSHSRSKVNINKFIYGTEQRETRCIKIMARTDLESGQLALEVLSHRRHPPLGLLARYIAKSSMAFNLGQLSPIQHASTCSNSNLPSSPRS